MSTITRLQISDVLIEGATGLDAEVVDLSKQPEVAQLFEETKKRQEDIKKLREVDEEQLKLVVQL